MEKLEFEWDEGNHLKSVNKHGVSNSEAESVFYDDKKLIYLDVKHSEAEKRYICISKSCFDRLLYVVFTRRKEKFRIISSRLANKKNKNQYDTQTI